MPDLNTVPASPRGLASSKKDTTNITSPTTAPANSENILPSNQAAVNPQTDGTAVSSSAASPRQQPAQPSQTPPQGDSAVGAGPGPMRHPRPLTASELHMQLEKEQEAVVNRLTRELTMLRAAHNASVASNTSSVSGSTSTHDVNESSLLSGTGFSIPSGARHQRTPSTASQTHSAQLGSSYEGRSSRMDGSVPRTGQSNVPPSLDPVSYFHNQRVPQSASVAATPSAGDQLSPGLMPATMRFEETAHYRHELDVAKRENDALKRRVRELERMVRNKSRDNSRARSDSVSTTASASVPTGGGASIAPPREPSVRPERGRNLARQSVASVGVGVPDEELKVGESAASAGLKGEQTRTSDS